MQNRPVKFRLVRDGKVVGYETLTHSTHPGHCDWEHTDLDGKRERDFPYHILHDAKEQFTGIVDKNGTQIYENDMIVVLHKCNKRGPIVFKYGCFGYYDLAEEFIILNRKQGNYSGKMSEIEVVGRSGDE